MAQSDWTTISTTANNYFNSISGTATQHNTLPTPITSSGTWCREFNSTGSSVSAVAGLMPISNSILTSSLGYLYGFTYSMRCWMRLTNPNGGWGYAANPSRPARLSLTFKNFNNLSVQNFNNTTILKGYSLNYFEGPEGYNGYGGLTPPNAQLILRCINNTASYGSLNASLNPADNNNGYQHVIYQSQEGSIWKRFRMDVTSLPNSDRITVFSGSQVEGDWSQLHQVEIPRTKIAAYVPWYNHPVYPTDNTGSANTGYMGIIYGCYSNTRPVYVDGFEAYREAIIT